MAEQDTIPTKGTFQLRHGPRTTQPAGIEADIYVDHELINSSIDISCPWAEQETIPTKGTFQMHHRSRTTQPTGTEADIYFDH